MLFKSKPKSPVQASEQEQAQEQGLSRSQSQPHTHKDGAVLIGRVKAAKANASNESSTTHSASKKPLFADDNEQIVTDGYLVLARQRAAAEGEKISERPLVGLKKTNLAVSELKTRLSNLSLSFAALSLCALLLAAYIYQCQKSTVVPYLVTVDSHGVVLGREVAPQRALSEQIPDAVIESLLSEFIKDLRMVTPDKAIQTDLIERVFSHVVQGSQVNKDLSVYYTTLDPINSKTVKKVSVEIANVIHRGEKTLQIDWNETITLTRNDQVNTVKKRALVSYDFLPIEQFDATTRLNNPLNLIITELIISDVMA